MKSRGNCGNALLLYMQNTLGTRLNHQIILEVCKGLFSHVPSIVWMNICMIQSVRDK